MIRTLALAGIIALPAHAQQPVCAPRTNVLPLIAGAGQSVRWMGTVRDRQVLELFTAPSGRWVILATTPNGVACIVAAGDAFEAIAEVPGDPT